MTYGYCRISIRKQNIERQIRNILSEFPDAVILQEEYTGTKLDRKEWNKLFNSVRTGDTIIFDSVRHMRRCTSAALISCFSKSGILIPTHTVKRCKTVCSSRAAMWITFLRALTATCWRWLVGRYATPL